MIQKKLLPFCLCFLWMLAFFTLPSSASFQKAKTFVQRQRQSFHHEDVTVFVGDSSFLGHNTIKSRTIAMQQSISLNDIMPSEDETYYWSPMQQVPELWLDLRDTLLHPKAALSYLFQELLESPPPAASAAQAVESNGSNNNDQVTARDDENNDNNNNNSDDTVYLDPLALPSNAPSPVTRVIVSERTFQQILDSPKKQQQDDLNGCDLLYVLDDSDDLILSSCGQSFPIGRLVNMEPNSQLVVSDPMPSIETLSCGKWIALMDDQIESNNNNDNNNNNNNDISASVASFLDLIYAAAGNPTGSSANDTSKPTTAGGLILPQKLESPASTSNIDLMCGGVALRCRDRSSLLQMASALQTMRAGTTTTSTESGILLRSTEPAALSIATALVLPFDIAMWKAALLVCGIV